MTCTHCEQKYIYYHRRKVAALSRSVKHSNSIDAGIPLNSSSSPIVSQKTDYIASFSNLFTPTATTAKESTTTVAITSTEMIPEDEIENDRCPYTVKGNHEPNLVMKDNDLKYKIRLPKTIAVSLVDQLKKDAEFLYSIGVMDFSLLGNFK